MIDKPTVFILGAGASLPYGFPLGSTLVNDIVTYHVRHEVAANTGIELAAWNQFRSDLNQSGCTSIDAFLQHRDEWREIGRKVIAFHLIAEEHPAKVFNPKGDDWMKYLFNQVMGLEANFQTFRGNRVKFITYNYDRSLEFALFNYLTYTYGQTADSVAEVMKEIDILHVHGLLDDFKPIAGTGRDYNHSNNDVHIIHNAASKIKIIHDGVNDEILVKARQMIEWAKQIFFLGFGYHHINMERLQLESTATTNLSGTAYGMTPAERSLIQRRLQERCKRTGSQIELVFTGDADRITSLDFLRQRITSLVS